MAEQSGKPVTGVRLRVYGGGEQFGFPQANDVASRLESVFGMKGSTIFEQSGRWDDEVEHGYVIELVFDNHGAGVSEHAAVDAYVWQGRKAEHATLKIAHVELQDYRASWGRPSWGRHAPTFYVTAEVVRAMEVF